MPVPLLGTGRLLLPSVGAAYRSVVTSIRGLVAYWPLNEAFGTSIADASGNGRGGVSSGVSLAQPGQVGPCYQFAGSGLVSAGAAFRAALNPAEFSVSMLVNIHSVPAQNVRLHNMFLNSLAEYSAAECRNGNRLDGYLQENGVSQAGPGFETIPNDTWLHLIYFNSVSTGQFGYYVNGLYLPAGRVVTGLAVPVIDSPYPQIGTNLIGYLQHVAWYNRLLTQAEADRLYRAAFSPATAALLTLADDAYTTAASNPLTTPRAGDPGPGNWDLTDTGSLLSTSTGSLRWTGKPANFDPRQVSTATYARKQGRAVLGRLTPGSLAVGWGLTTGRTGDHQGVLLQSATLFVQANASQLNLGTAASSVEYRTASVMRRNGATHWIKGGAFGEWTLLYVSRVGSAAAYAGVGEWSVSTTNAVNRVEVVDLPAPFNKDFDLASTRLAGGRTAGDTFAHPADCILTFAVTTRPTSGNIDVRFRAQGPSDYWQVTVDSTGALVLNEVVAGSATQRGTGAGVNSAWEVQILAVGSSIRVVTTDATDSAVVKISYASAMNFQAATAGSLADEGAGGSVSALVVYPVTASPAAIAVLDAAI